MPQLSPASGCLIFLVAIITLIGFMMFYNFSNRPIKLPIKISSSNLLSKKVIYI